MRGNRNIGDERSRCLRVVSGKDNNRRVFAASPRSASQTSPCLTAIDNVEYFLLDLA